MSLSLTLKAGIRGTQTSALDLGTSEFPFEIQSAIALASGVAANQADVLFTDTRTLGASSTEDLDLSGTLAGALGSTAVFAKVKAIVITAAAGNTKSVQVTRPAANGVPLFLAASDGLAIPPGGVFAFAGPALAGLCSVTAGTGDLLTITNSAGGTGVTYSIAIVGTSA
jgi:hypothetical protein